MTERVFRRFDRETGKLVETVHTTTTAETLEERFDGLMAQGREQLGGKVEVLFFKLRCDGCGVMVDLEGRPSLPEGWSTSEAGELCPTCTDKRC